MERTEELRDWLINRPVCPMLRMAELQVVKEAELILEAS